MSKHTPGPWIAKNTAGAGLEIMAKVDLGRDKYGGVLQPIYELSLRPFLRVEDGGAVTMMLTYESWRQFPSINFQEMQNANAAVIAAAPDLLAVAEGCLGYLASMPFGSGPDEAWLEPLRAAIKKAKGEA